MKKVILIILVTWVVVFGQNSGFDNSVKSSLNSTTTTMTAGGIFTGGSDLVRGYNTVSVTVRSDSSGSYKVLFADAYTMTSKNVVRIDSIAYTGGDTTHTRYFNIVAPYFKVIYTNGADSQGVFYLTTMFHKGQSSAIDNNGFLKVSTLPTFALGSTGFTTGTIQRATYLDSLTGWVINDPDTVTFNFGNQYRTCAVVVRDTTGGSALIDSLKIETYNAVLGVYGTKIVGLYEPSTGDILSGDCIVPGNGTTKKYFLNDIYPSWIRVTWYSGNDSAKANRKVYLSFEGSN